MPERYSGAWISATSLQLLRVVPELGRVFTAADEGDDASPVILISHRVWQQRYGGRASILGTEVRANGSLATIVGVLPAGFRFPIRQDIWLPLRLEAHRLPRGEGATLEVGRLRGGFTRQRAVGEMTAIAF